MYESVTAPGEFIIVETWESQEALDRHMKQPHFIEYATKLDSYGKMHTDRYEF
ncbi:MAG: antibiotic biosynthesis monooxygenase [Muribaculaceae bacterium]|nr:antibiotic biosynthesis monooxygenase [Muribaculaceae bacterium]